MTLASKTFQALMGTKKRMVTRGNAFAAEFDGERADDRG